jgi:hypothetical protein
MLETELTTIQVTKGASKRLREIAEYFRRSKTGQLEWWIENEHRRIFKDGEQEQVLSETISAESQP